MTRPFIELGLETLPLLVAAALMVAGGRRAVRLNWLGVALLLILIHEFLLTRFLWQLPLFPDEDGWNWVGKLLALAATLAIAALPAFGWRRAGITLRQAPGSWPAWTLTGAMAAWSFGNALLTDTGVPPDTTRVAYMWTMPGPQEELFYRGLLLLALNEAFTARRRIFGAEMGWAALLVSIQFGAVHGLGYSDGQPFLDAGYFWSTFVIALLWVWIRERTGSLLAPIISHSLGNGLKTLL